MTRQRLSDWLCDAGIAGFLTGQLARTGMDVQVHRIRRFALQQLSFSANRFWVVRRWGRPLR